ncbi:DEAD-box ATP-dependent RNA helicase [Acrasis kona]|uniref:Probable eukaryotic initiation factor 4A n=1 Tax=Acrasis kona TaxID=1008807 RepID=A0AAW2YML7_9EUKA
MSDSIPGFDFVDNSAAQSSEDEYDDDEEDVGSQKQSNVKHTVEFEGEEPEDPAEKKKKKKKKPSAGGFAAMNLSPQILKGIKKKGYRFPTPIQRKAIPVILTGKDIVAMARTGSGKTATFLIPMIQQLKCEHSKKVGCRALIISPTRELAMQTAKFFKQLGGETTDLRYTILVGGDSMDNQFSDLSNNPDIIICTPGRLLHIISETGLSLKAIEYVVLDEADRLFEMGLGEQVTEIASKLPTPRQTLLFSATMPAELVEFTKAGLNSPTLVRLDSESKISDQLKINFLCVRSQEKDACLIYLLRELISANQLTILFASTKHHVDYLHGLLTHFSIESTIIYGTMDQEARRNNLHKFRMGRIKLLIVTDVAARGIDIPLLDNVVNYDFPSKPKLFIHRVGRAARAGRSGCAYSLVQMDELPYMVDLHLFLGRSLKGAPSSEEAAQIDDGHYGIVPQTVIDNEHEEITKLLHQDKQLESEKNVCDRAFKLYSRTRAPPSQESIRRAKDIKMEVHPLVKSKLGRKDSSKKAFNDPIAQHDLMNQLKSFRPNQTIFEFGTQGGEEAAVMKERRTFKSNAKLFKTSKDENSDSDSEQDGQPQNDQPKKKLSLAESLLDKNRKKDRFLQLVKNEADDAPKKSNTSFKDPNFYMSYERAGDSQRKIEDKGYSIEGNMNEVQPARQVIENEQVEERIDDMVMDLNPEDRSAINNKSRSLLKWDAKKKNYVRVQLAPGQRVGANGKIRNEAGVLIKKKKGKEAEEFYQKWKKKTHGRIQHVGEEEETSGAISRGSAAKQVATNDYESEMSEDENGEMETLVNGKKRKRLGDPNKKKKKVKVVHGTGDVKSELIDASQMKKRKKVDAKKKRAEDIRQQMKKQGYQKVKQRLVNEGMRKAAEKRQQAFNKNSKVKVKVFTKNSKKR